MFFEKGKSGQINKTNNLFNLLISRIWIYCLVPSTSCSQSFRIAFSSSQFSKKLLECPYLTSGVCLMSISLIASPDVCKTFWRKVLGDHLSLETSLTFFTTRLCRYSIYFLNRRLTSSNSSLLYVWLLLMNFFCGDCPWKLYLNWLNCGFIPKLSLKLLSKLFCNLFNEDNDSLLLCCVAYDWSFF